MVISKEIAKFARLQANFILFVKKFTNG